MNGDGGVGRAGSGSGGRGRRGHWNYGAHRRLSIGEETECTQSAEWVLPRCDRCSMSLPCAFVLQ